jgi:hypothetical protein
MRHAKGIFSVNPREAKLFLTPDPLCRRDVFDDSSTEDVRAPRPIGVIKLEQSAPASEKYTLRAKLARRACAWFAESGFDAAIDCGGAI